MTRNQKQIAQAMLLIKSARLSNGIKPDSLADKSLESAYFELKHYLMETSPKSYNDIMKYVNS